MTGFKQFPLVHPSASLYYTPFFGNFCFFDTPPLVHDLALSFPPILTIPIEKAGFCQGGLQKAGNNNKAKGCVNKPVADKFMDRQAQNLMFCMGFSLCFALTVFPGVDTSLDGLVYP